MPDRRESDGSWSDLDRTGGYGDPWDEGAVSQLAERLVSEIMAAAESRMG